MCGAWGVCLLSGVDLRRHFYALYVPNSASAGDRPFPLFIRARGQVETPSPSSIYLATLAETPCGGSAVGKPTEVREAFGRHAADPKFFVAESAQTPNPKP